MKQDRIPVNTAHKNIPLEKILALRIKGLSQAEIAATLGCDSNNIQVRLQKILKELELLEDFKAHKADLLANVQRQILLSITNDDIKNASFPARAVAFGVFFDKEQLLRGRPTQLIAYADILKMREKLQSELKGLEAGQNDKPNDTKG